MSNSLGSISLLYICGNQFHSRCDCNILQPAEVLHPNFRHRMQPKICSPAPKPGHLYLQHCGSIIQVLRCRVPVKCIPSSEKLTDSKKGLARASLSLSGPVLYLAPFFSCRWLPPRILHMKVNVTALELYCGREMKINIYSKSQLYNAQAYLGLYNL